MTQNCPKEKKAGVMTEQVKDGELLGKMGKQGDPGIAAGPTLEMQYGISALPSFPSHSSDDQLQFSSSQFS